MKKGLYLAMIIFYLFVISLSKYILDIKNDPDFPLTVLIAIIMSSSILILALIIDISEIISKINGNEAKDWLMDIRDVYKSSIIGLSGFIALLWGLIDSSNWDFLRLQTYLILLNFVYLSIFGLFYIYLPLRKQVYKEIDNSEKE